ncbi:MAG: methyltransferase domain-containing protein [Vicinamibacterales bacterium]|jgi:cyclopropane fatty-acyl-phospholipid synthase-like methyltransferase|nr:methyltransferase domain-containing protein [Vicinamibacterales bacterium]
MVEFDAADVRRYYDRHTDDFVAYGQGGAVGALHRAVWGPGTNTADAAFRYVEDRILEHLRTIPRGPEPAHVVDLGCGVGASLCYLAEHWPIRGTGVTLSPVQVRHAEDRIKNAGLSDRVVCLEGDYCALPDEAPPADLAYAIESFVHGPDPSRFFAACARLVRLDGLLVICDDFRRPVASPAAIRAVERFRRGWHLNSLLHPDELERLAADAGFEHVSTSDLTPHLHVGRPRDRLTALFIALFGWLPLDTTRFGHLVGGSALQTCLARDWIGYDLALFRRRH